MVRVPVTAATWLAPLGAVGVAGAAALPWAYSGRRAVSGYDLSGVARAFGLTDRGAVAAAATAWRCVPVVAAASAALAALGRRGTATVLAAAVCAVGLLVAVWVVRAAPDAAASGAPLTIGCSVVGLAGAAVGGAAGRRSDTRRSGP